MARLSSDRLQAQLNLQAPQQGLHCLSCDQQSPSGTILGLHPVLGLGGVGDSNDSLGPIEDCYVRGDDLIATYSQAEDRPRRTQVSWRFRESAMAEKFAGVEMVVSVQTDSLNSLPELESETRLAAEEVLHLTDPSNRTAESLQQDLTLRASQGPCCIVVRLKDLPLSYVEMEPALDFHQMQVEVSGNGVPGNGVSDKEACLRHRLFSQHLEKGVILRARVCGVFVPRADDIRTAASFYEQLNREELPLTT